MSFMLHGYWLANCDRDGAPALVCVDLDRMDPDLDVALNKARPWRAVARAGRMVDAPVNSRRTRRATATRASRFPARKRLLAGLRLTEPITPSGAAADTSWSAIHSGAVNPDASDFEGSLRGNPQRTVASWAGY
jgi:hypothetical protein